MHPLNDLLKRIVLLSNGFSGIHCAQMPVKEVRYRHKRNGWSIHYNMNSAQTLFCSDGADSAHVAHGLHASWLYLFQPEGDHLSAERLVDMKRHQYQLEPNVHFTPDGKWIVFRSNMFGLSNVLAVKL
jgi:oligogalacturonide lyase